MNITLDELKERVIKLVENNACEQKSRAWLVATYVSLKAADELKYVDDTFHSFSIQEQIDALKSVVKAGIFEVDISSKNKERQDHTVIWLRGFYFNDALMRMAALTERGLVYLWEIVNLNSANNKLVMNRNCEFRFWQLKEWYENIFQKNIEILAKVREQVNVFKHKSRILGVWIFDKYAEALIAFSQVLELIEFTTTKPDSSIKDAHSDWCKSTAQKMQKPNKNN